MKEINRIIGSYHWSSTEQKKHIAFCS